jgi:hypothetical protein
MNLQKEKRLFDLQYFDQKVWMFSHIPPHAKEELRPVARDFAGESIGYLLLKSINDLTDEEAMKLALVLEPEVFTMDDVITVQRFPDFIFMMCNQGQVQINFNGPEGLFSNDDNYLFHTDLIYQCYSMLKLWGYLLPFTYIDETGKPVTLSPEEIIALKWAQYATA